MYCNSCGGRAELKKGDYKFKTKTIGKIKVPDIEVMCCDNCEETFLSIIEAQKVYDYISDLERLLI